MREDGTRGREVDAGTLVLLKQSRSYYGVVHEQRRYMYGRYRLCAVLG